MVQPLPTAMLSCLMGFLHPYFVVEILFHHYLPLAAAGRKLLLLLLSGFFFGFSLLFTLTANPFFDDGI
jgi:hypothetical protein